MLDGRTALNYVRARHVEAEGNGDYGRITRQQKFLSALLRSALSNQVLLNPSKLNGFINAFTSDTSSRTSTRSRWSPSAVRCRTSTRARSRS